MKKSEKTYLVSILIPLATGGVSALLSMSGMAAYQGLAKPPFSPPGILFPVVWTILYVLMGISSALVYTSRKPETADALILYGIQLAINFFWPVFFFRLQWRLFAFFWILLLIAAVITMIRRFRGVVPLAGNLQIPYLLWLIFAAYLNLGIVFLN